MQPQESHDEIQGGGADYQSYLHKRCLSKRALPQKPLLNTQSGTNLPALQHAITNQVKSNPKQLSCEKSVCPKKAMIKR